MISTNHAALYFQDSGSPTKRASAHLRLLEDQKVIEGRSRAIGLPKVWRLTKRGREQLGVTARPISFTSGKMEHWLSITSDYIELSRMGDLTKWEVEPRYKFKVGNKEMIYSPDAYFTFRYNGKRYAYFLEHQYSPITSKRWAEKWAVFSQFKDSPDFIKASFQTSADKGIRITPRIMVISSQLPETVQGGSNLKLYLAKDIKSISL